MVLIMFCSIRISWLVQVENINHVETSNENPRCRRIISSKKAFLFLKCYKLANITIISIHFIKQNAF